MTAPFEGVSRPARMLSTVVLPQPEWPITQANSPRSIASHRFSKMVVTPAARSRVALGDAFERDEFVAHARYSGNVTRRAHHASIWSSTMPTSPISKIALITLVIDKLFHSFQTK